MAAISVLLPHRDAAAALESVLPALATTLAALGRSFEAVVVDGGSSSLEAARVRQLPREYSFVRLVALDRPAGLSAALTAGIAASRGEVIVAVDPRGGYPLDEIGGLIRGLARGDIVFARPRRSGLAKAWQRVARIPRWLLLGLEVREPECLFWAARREAVHGLDLPRGMYRYLANFVSRRGYRVCERAMDAAPAAAALGDGWPNPGDLLAAWWLTRRRRPYTAHEIGRHEQAGIDGARVERLPFHDHREPAHDDPRGRRDKAA
jgi:glycosyltransferase involved in cell wall biosynthesis